MHRSGTSLVARLLGELGCSYGGEVAPAKDDNPLGFWEHAEIVDVHNDFLAARGRLWSDPRPLSAEDFQSTAAREAGARLTAIFRRDFQERRRWVIKDPRLCRLLPLWQDLLSGTGHRIAYLHVTRHPIAVARSLSKRNGFSESSGLALWLRHVLEGERATRGYARAWVSFEQLVDSPAERMHRAIRHLGAAEDFDLEASMSSIENATRRDLVHHQVEEDVDVESPWVRSTQRALQQLLEGESEAACDELDRVADELGRQDSDPLIRGSFELLGRIVAQETRQVTELRAETDIAHRHIAKLEEDLGSVEDYCRRLDRELTEKARHEATQASYTRKLEKLIATARSSRPT